MILSVSDSRSSHRRARPVLAAPIVAVTVQRRDLALRTPLETAQGPVATRAVFLLSVRDADGLVGLGEASPLDWAGTETVEQCAQALAGLDDALLRGGDVHAALVGRPAAAAALDLALHDLAACRLAVPLARLLGEEVADSVAVNALVSGVADSVAAVAAGFRTLKLKIGPDSAGLARVIRDSVGSEVALRLDANGLWPDAEAALAGLAPYEALGIEYVEQPIAPGPDAARELARVRAGTPIPVAADESLTDVAAAHALVEHGAVDVFILKPMRLGGLDRSLDVAQVARDAGLAVVVTGFLGSAVERAAALHLAAALDGAIPPEQRRAHGLGAGGWLAEDVAAVDPIEGGRLILPARAGHGVVLPS